MDIPLLGTNTWGNNCSPTYQPAKLCFANKTKARNIVYSSSYTLASERTSTSKNYFRRLTAYCFVCKLQR